MGTFVGRDVLVEFAIANEDASTGSLVYNKLGMYRGQAIDTTWETVDSTASDSANFTKTNLVTFKNVTLSMDGVSYDDAVHNQETLEAHVVNPPSTTSYQPKVWFKVTYPSGKIYEGPFIITKWGNSVPYADVATWSIEAMSNGAVTCTL